MVRSPFFVGATVVSVETVGVDPKVTTNVGGGVGGGVGRGDGLRVGGGVVNLGGVGPGEGGGVGG